MVSETSPTTSIGIDYRHYVVPTDIVSSWPVVRGFLGEGSVLDLGCGDGGYLGLLSPTSVGVDLSEENLAKAAAKGLRVVQGDLQERLPFEDASFDGVLCSHVLEHVESPLGLLREIVRVAKPGAPVAVGVPVEGGAWRSIRRLHVFRDHPEHLYAFSPDGLRRLASVVGLEDGRVIFDAPLAKRLGVTNATLPFNRLPEWLKRQASDSMWILAHRAS